MMVWGGDTIFSGMQDRGFKALRLLRHARRRMAAALWRGPLHPVPRLMRRLLPKGLFARSLIIIIAPVVLLQCVVTVVFMERHWQLVTQRLSEAVVRDIAAVMELIADAPNEAERDRILRTAQERLDLGIALLPPGPLPAPAPRPFFNILDGILSREIASQIGRPFWIDTVGDSAIVEIRLKLENQTLRIFAPRNSAYASNTHIFLVWMVVTSLILLVIAIVFLRNQIRPIQDLAQAAETFGRGLPMREPFRPRGASEVRRAAIAFSQMRDRIERQIEQRTQMLSGVSHDLRTVLTRFRLQLAFLGDGEDVRELQSDVDEMQRMLEGYLAFARGEAAEEVDLLDLRPVLDRLRDAARTRGTNLTIRIEGDGIVRARPQAFSRMITNVVTNAVRHGSEVKVSVSREERWLAIVVEDDGPGIAAQDREEVFKPFVRLDEARNIDAGGTGLGLAIARDVARSHGGDILLSRSDLGGLRALIRIPA